MNYQHQNQSAQSHIKWPEFAAWCRTKGGAPSENGFWSWLCKQKPQWRNKIRQNFEQSGYVLDGEFFTTEQANQMAADDPNLTIKFRPAVKRRNGTIKITQ